MQVLISVSTAASHIKLVSLKKAKRAAFVEQQAVVKQCRAELTAAKREPNKQIRDKSVVRATKKLTTATTKLEKLKEAVSAVDVLIRESKSDLTAKPDKKPVAESSDDLVKRAQKSSKENAELNAQLNGRSKGKAKNFGYWRSLPTKELASLPFPVAFPVKGYNKDTFIRALKTYLKSCRKTEYRGMSPNRWTGASNGSAEYSSKTGWTMPEGALFYLERGVPPTQEFYKEVTGKSNVNLPSIKNYVTK